MSLIGGYRYTSPSSSSALNPDNTIVNFMGFPVSGLSDSNAIACCLYVWNPTAKNWEPMTQP